MIVKYDDEVDAVYLQLSDAVPDGVVEIEILSASLKMDINTLLTYKLEFDRTILQPHEV